MKQTLLNFTILILILLLLVFYIVKTNISLVNDSSTVKVDACGIFIVNSESDLPKINLDCNSGFSDVSHYNENTDIAFLGQSGAPHFNVNGSSASFYFKTKDINDMSLREAKMEILADPTQAIKIYSLTDDFVLFSKPVWCSNTGGNVMVSKDIWHHDFSSGVTEEVESISDLEVTEPEIDKVWGERYGEYYIKEILSFDAETMESEYVVDIDRGLEYCDKI